MQFLLLDTIDCHWSAWSPWSNCSSNLLAQTQGHYLCGEGKGMQLRKRFASTAPQDGGKKCTGAPRETANCTLPNPENCTGKYRTGFLASLQLYYV